MNAVRLLPLFVALITQPTVAQSRATAGPLVGDVTSDSATVWFFAPEGNAPKVAYRSAESDGPMKTASLELVEEPAGKAQGRPATVTIDELSPGTRYIYRVETEGEEGALEGSFRTPPPAGDPSTFRMVLTSCMRFDQPQGSWKLVLKEDPDLHLTVGDTHYADTTDPTVQWAHHLRYRRLPEYAEVLRQIPVYSMWDDHDYGPNNSDGTAAGKENSLAGWKQFWANPGAGTEETPGAFYRFSRGDVDFFVIDSRYHRSPDKAPDDEKKRMLGDAQFEWLLDGLKSSQAKFKVIASGSTLDHSSADGWKIYTFSRHRLFDALNEHQIPGVVYMSGDIHNSLVWEHPESNRVGYPLVEVISSGVANSKTLSFATIDFDTKAEDPVMRVRVIQGDGQVREDKSWKLSQLSHDDESEGEGGNEENR